MRKVKIKEISFSILLLIEKNGEKGSIVKDIIARKI
jgi:hypothetical protein